MKLDQAKARNQLERPYQSGTVRRGWDTAGFTASEFAADLMEWSNAIMNDGYRPPVPTREHRATELLACGASMDGLRALRDASYDPTGDEFEIVLDLLKMGMSPGTLDLCVNVVYLIIDERRGITERDATHYVAFAVGCWGIKPADLAPLRSLIHMAVDNSGRNA